MTVKIYVNDIIDNHQSNNGIYFDLNSRDYIQRNIENGIFAFQIIYSLKLDINEMLVVTLVKNLNYNKLLFRKGYEDGISDMWSYDNTDNYKYSERETLIFNPSIIRNIKLNQILN
jgi:hypothetical protein